jgi:glycosyltransferase involved in cell wall biosynthesis
MNIVKVLHYSPHNENDGIAKYQEQYLAGMSNMEDVKNEFFDISPHQFRHFPPDKKSATLRQLEKTLKNFDIFHIQHEFGLFDEEDFLQIAEVAKRTKVKLVISVHLSPGYAIKKVSRGGLGPRSLMAYARDQRHRARMIERHVRPMLMADLLLVHNDITASSLVEFGANPNKIKKLPHPVYEWPTPEETRDVRDNLKKQDGDVIFCTVGMLHRYKGIFDAVSALKFLPVNYKLAILGGMHPMSDEVKIYNKISDLIDALGLHDRVYISGFVEDDNLLNSYIRECDISVFPYDGSYYGHLSSGSINLGFSNHKPVIVYPTNGFRELAEAANGAVVLCDTFAYYELARELKRVDIPKQQELSKKYAEAMAWSKVAGNLAILYKSL